MLYMQSALIRVFLTPSERGSRYPLQSEVEDVTRAEAGTGEAETEANTSMTASAVRTVLILDFLVAFIVITFRKGGTA